MKIFLALVLGVVLLTSALGGVYANTFIQPSDNHNFCPPNPAPNPNPNPTYDCHAGRGSNNDPKSHGCTVDSKAADGTCHCEGSITPNVLTISDIQPNPSCRP